MAYDGELAAQYAVRWAHDRNDRFGDFTQLGGDCANFVSQCLLAGGCRMDYVKNTGWYYRGMNDRAPAWSGARELAEYLSRERDGVPAAPEIEPSAARPGDVVFLSDGARIYHALIVVLAGNPPLVAAHTRDACYAPLTDYPAARLLALHVRR